MIEFPIKNKLSNQIQFTAQIDCDESTSYSQKLGLAVKWTIKNNVCHLSDLDLRGADLRGANLFDADLRGVDLTDAYLQGANLCCADLQDTNLFDADLRGANLKGANLYGADLRGANLKGANLMSVDLTGAYLTGELSEEQLRNYKHDFWGILLQYRNEVEPLREHILAGKINGSMYSGECACLMGTIANIKGCKVDELEINDNSYIESWFTMIKEGDTPENNYASEMTLKWLDEFVSLTK